jgi:hypothetical protein
MWYRNETDRERASGRRRRGLREDRMRWGKGAEGRNG